MNKITTYAITFLFAFALFATNGCKKEEPTKTINPKEFLYGKWKYEGCGTINPETFKGNPQPNADTNFYISFKKNDSIFGRTAYNDLNGKFDICGGYDEVNDCYTFAFLYLDNNYTNAENGDSEEFYYGLITSSNKFRIKDNKLFIFYEQNHYLQLNKVE